MNGKRAKQFRRIVKFLQKKDPKYDGKRLYRMLKGRPQIHTGINTAQWQIDLRNILNNETTSN